MEVQESSLKTLLDSAEDYVKTSYELIRLKTIDKATDKIALIVSRAIAFFAFFMFLILASFGLGLWLGNVLGNSWYGFFVVAGIYGIAGIVLYFFTHNAFKKAVGDSIIKQTFK